MIYGRSAADVGARGKRQSDLRSEIGLFVIAGLPMWPRVVLGLLHAHDLVRVVWHTVGLIICIFWTNNTIGSYRELRRLRTVRDADQRDDEPY